MDMNLGRQIRNKSEGWRPQKFYSAQWLQNTELRCKNVEKMLVQMRQKYLSI